MIRTLWIFPLFIIGVGTLMIFNIMILGLGDPKFSKDLSTALVFYSPIWLVIFMPHMIIGWLLFTVKIPKSHSQTYALAGLSVLVLFIIELSFILDLKLMALLVESVILLIIAWFIRCRLLGAASYEKA